MDILRLPSSLRQAIFSFCFCKRSINTSCRQHATSTQQYVPHDALEDQRPEREQEQESPLTLTSTSLNSYNVSEPPTPPDLKSAHAFFTRTKPEILYSAAHFRAIPPSPFPEVAFLGRSNVGKSSILNGLFGRTSQKVAHISKRPGKTITMNGYGVGGEGFIGKKAAKGEDKQARWTRYGRGGLIIVDMPGYGQGSREAWGTEIMKYLENRKQLRRTYVLVDAEHGLKKMDLQLLVHLRTAGIAHQVVLSKVDKLLFPHAKMPSPQKLHKGLVGLREVQSKLRYMLDEAVQSEGGRGVMGDILCCSSEKSLDVKNKSRKIGIDELRWSVLTACGLENITSRSAKSRIKTDDGDDDGDVHVHAGGLS